MSKRKGIVLIILAIVLIVSITALYLAARSVYGSRFNIRCTTSKKDAFDIASFETLKRERYTFPTKQGHQLIGYLYEHNDPAQPEKGVIVFAHGFGAGGQNGYMDSFDYLTKQGYYVFAYDATANDESEGAVVGGLPQGYIDLDYAIGCVYGIEKVKDLPLMLMGYSWGALSVTNVLNFRPEVKAVVSLAGCNRSMDLIEYHGCKMVGKAAKFLIPFAWMHEYLKYGKYACSTAMKGFANSDCRVMIVHGALDQTVPSEYGYDAYYKKYSSDERFVFKKYKYRDHDLLRENRGKRYLDLELMGEIAAFFDQSLTK
ncbi:MAG: alpha/beta hydrolase [Clostridia bacterium]|nr:alpha/beta hydrolase [Clostridia bacterium]